MTPTTLVVAASASLREAAIAQAVRNSSLQAEPGSITHAVLLEGLPDGQALLETLQQDDPHTLTLIRIAPGCLCCIGNVVLKVSINRLLRQRPQHLWISLANTSHIDQLRTLLQSPPFDTLLELTKP